MSESNDKQRFVEMAKQCEEVYHDEAATTVQKNLAVELIMDTLKDQLLLPVNATRAEHLHQDVMRTKKPWTRLFRQL